MSNRPLSNFVRRSLAMLTLVLAGEVIFFLPFVLARVFRPTLLDVFGLTNLELGMAFSVYGVVAMLAYFPGGPLADRFAARKMMVLALLATSAGGLVMLSIPSLVELRWLYGYWGLTTILLFWAPLIRATRQWSAGQLPGRAFGLLDGGRGLAAAAIGTGAVYLYGALLPPEVESASLVQRTDALRWVILIFTAITFFTGFLVWFGSPREDPASSVGRDRFQLSQVTNVLFLPTVWLQAIIVVCAYVGYKGLDDISLYANEVLLLDEVDSAKVSTVMLWVRPFAAILAGFVADRAGVTKSTIVCFLVLVIASAVMAAGILRPGMVAQFFVTLITTSAAIFALRGLYFAIMDEGRVPFEFTGTAVGLVSVIGYTPDVFMGPLMGILLDRSPGARGHQHVFAPITVFAIVGLIAVSVFWRITHRGLRVVESADKGSL